ncbi:MAG: hypothetical protein CMH60_03795 [Myxococcales bacterium]|nr:hypothetical protein [Myxococcales bacterium]
MHAGGRMSNIKPLKQRTVLVTGSNSGIGLATTQMLLDAGARVVGISKKETSAIEQNSNFSYFSVNLALVDKVGKQIQTILKEHPDIDTVVANAGCGTFGHLEQIRDEELIETVNLNLTSQVILAKALTPHLKTRGDGDFIFVGSIAAIHPGKRGALYSATKSGVQTLAKVLREECASRNVRVMLIQPGMTQTNFYHNLNFEPGEEPEQHLEAKDVATLITDMLCTPRNMVLDEVTASPLTKVVKFK